MTQYITTRYCSDLNSVMRPFEDKIRSRNTLGPALPSAHQIMTVPGARFRAPDWSSGD